MASALIAELICALLLNSDLCALALLGMLLLVGGGRLSLMALDA